MTGVIYVVIIALWAAVLIPLWLRRHDQISEVRSTARFHSAMRTLSSSRAYSMDESRGARRAGDMDDYGYQDFDDRWRDADRELARQQASTRRAAVLGVLALVLLMSLVLAFMSVVPKWVPALTALPVVAFIVATMMTAPAREAGRVRRSEPARRTETVAVDVAAPVTSAAVDDDWENWNAWDDDDAWEAIPTTLPTYVTAPRASAVPRRIDRSRPGEWTGTAMVETAQAMRARSIIDEPVDHAAQTAEIPVVQAPAPRVVNE